MDKDSAWIDNSEGALLQYDFFAPGHWPRERVAAEQAAIAALIEAQELDSDAPGWLQLARRLPTALKTALLAELRAGNALTGIVSTGWPDAGSIVVNLRDRFTIARQAPPPGVVWREPGDAHYAREELSQQVDGVAFLLLT